MARRGEKVTRSPVHLRAASVRLPLSAVILGWLGRGLGRAAARVLSQPVLWIALSVYGVGYWLAVNVGPWPFLLAAVLLTAVLVAWRQTHRASYRRFLAWPVRSTLRRAWVYRRYWQPAMVSCGLAIHLNGREFLPHLVKVSSTSSVDRVTVRMLAGQVIEDYAQVTHRLAQTFGAAECRVRTDPKRPDRVILWLLIRDPLAEPVAPFDMSESPNPARLAVARREDGLIYRLHLLGSHLLVVGCTGAGKSGVLWNLVHALAPSIHAGTTALWVLDPKGGMELAGGQAMFARFCYGHTPDPDEAALDLDDVAKAAHEHAYADLLEDAVHLMRARQERLRGVTRLHEPSTTEPLVVVVIDELAALTAYVTDRDAKRRISAALSLLLSQGRAVGVLVVAALQDPRKDVLPARDLFPTRIGLRMVDDQQIDMVLGDGAKHRGARCDRIPESLPGVGYVTLDGLTEPLRVRFAHLSDHDITRLARQYAPPADPAPGTTWPNSRKDDAA
jgi:DNA segregation ATPase FtsK/SpoIIIE, S-DNA-T family